MIRYLLKRLCLLPVTLLIIFLVNFIILNFSAKDSLTEKNMDSFGESGFFDTKSHEVVDAFSLFREHYGLTLPVLFNYCPYISQKTVKKALYEILRNTEKGKKIREIWSDRAKFIMPILLQEASSDRESLQYRILAVDLFIKGGIQQAVIKYSLSQKQKIRNQEISLSNNVLSSLSPGVFETDFEFSEKIDKLTEWFQKQGGMSKFSYTGFKALKTFFFKTRLCRYFSKVLRLDFGTLKCDRNQTVVDEVVKRLRCSLVLSILPTLLVFVLCQFLGLAMAVWQNRWIDHCLNFLFLILFAIPVFVAVPLLIETCVLNKTVPFTNIPMPYSGLSSSKDIFVNLSSGEKILDIILHSLLPFIAVSYGSLSAQSRFARAAFLEVFKQDYIRTAVAKGLSQYHILIKHVGRNAALTMITSLSSSFGVILGGSLVVETLFQIDGFGKFFYQAILNRDHNVILFSVLVGSSLSLLGYLIGDICYVLCDPRLQFNQSQG